MAERDYSRRFWSKVDRSGGPDACWPWTAARTDAGYGTFTIFYRTHYAHRVVYEMEMGPIPSGMVLHHRCENPPCVNPRHLEPTTRGNNVLIGGGKTAANARKTHCKRGHPLTEENIYRTPSRPNGRTCLTCKLLHSRKRANPSIFEEADGG